MKMHKGFFSCMLIIICVFVVACSRKTDDSSNLRHEDISTNEDISTGEVGTGQTTEISEVVRSGDENTTSQSDTVKSQYTRNTPTTKKEDNSYDDFEVSIISDKDNNAPKVKLKTRIIDIKDNKSLLPDIESTGLYCETPPWIQNINGTVKSFISTSWTGVVDVNPGKNFTLQNNVFNKGSKRLISSSDIMNFDKPTWNPDDIEGGLYWRRNYFGLFNTVSINKNNEEYILGIMHCENKNERFDIGSQKIYYDNSVLPKRKYSLDEYDGADKDGIYKESSKTYFAFTSLSVLPASDINKKTLHDGDRGPVVWPSAGYLTASGEQASQGIRHPTGFATDEYIYIYYLDTSMTSSESGRGSGLKVARSPVSSLGDPASFRNYYAGKWNEKSLPNNFNKSKNEMFYKQGGKGTAIVPNSVVRFTVAKVKNTKYYLSVEETFSDKGLSIMLRASADLVNWGTPVTIHNTASGIHTEGKLHYPIFYNKDFTSCTKIDKDEFYIGGTFGVGTPTHYYQYVKLAIDITDK